METATIAPEVTAFEVKIPRDVFAWVALAQSTEETRQHLAGVQVDTTGETVVVRASDAYRIHEWISEIESPEVGGTFWVRSEVVNPALKQKGPVVALRFEGERVAVGGVEAPTSYSNFPDTSTLWVEVDGEGREVGGMAGIKWPRAKAWRNLHGALVPVGSGAVLAVSSPRASDLPEGAAGVNPAYLAEALTCGVGARVHVIGSLRPLTVTREGVDGKFRALVMPVRLND